MDAAVKRGVECHTDHPLLCVKLKMAKEGVSLEGVTYKDKEV